MLVSDILTRVKRQFGDESGVQVTDADIIRWVNDGMRQIVQTNEGLLEKSATADLVEDQQEYTLPTDLLILKVISCKTSGESSYTPLRGMSFIDFNQRIDGWDGDTDSKARPELFTIFGGKIQLFPIPSEDTTAGLKIYYNKLPTDVTTTTDTPEIPTLYHEALVKYCLTQAYEMDEDFQASAQKVSELNTDLVNLRGRDDWKIQDTYPMITVMPWDDDRYGFF